MARELSQLHSDLDIMEIQSSLEELSVRSLVQAYRRRAMLAHPDKGGEEENCKGLGDSYKRLLRFLRKRTVSDTDVGRMTADHQEVVTAAEFFNRNNFTHVNTICVTVTDDSRKEAWGQTYSSHPYCGPSSLRECAVGATRIGLAWGRTLRTKFGPGKVVNSSGLQFKYGPLSAYFLHPKLRNVLKFTSKAVERRKDSIFVYTKIESL